MVYMHSCRILRILVKTLSHFSQRAILSLQHVMKVNFFIIWTIWRIPILHKLPIC